MSPAPHDAARRLIDLARTDVAALALNHNGIASALARLEETVSAKSFRAIDGVPARVPGCRWLGVALDHMGAAHSALAEAIRLSAPACCWRANGGYPEAAFAPGYFDNCAFCQIIGPHGLFTGDDLMLGLFVIGPNQLYPRHNHAAPELYYQLTGHHQWQLDDDPWINKAAPAVVWNEPYQEHALHTGDKPFLSIWMWTDDTHLPPKLL